MEKYYTNPFIINSPISEPELFVGRSRELENIYYELFGSFVPQSIAIYGPHRMGKSSLLRYLGSNAAVDYFRNFAQRRGQTEEENMIDRTVFVIVDLKILSSQYKSEDFVTAFWRELHLKGIEAVKEQALVHFNRLPDNIKGPQAGQAALTVDDWVNHLHQLIETTSEKDEKGEEKGLFFIFGLDHGEVIFDLGESGGYQVCQTLAVLGRLYRSRLVYVTVVPETLDRMERRFKGGTAFADSASPFYTGITHVYIGLLPSKEESMEVIIRPLERVNARNFFSEEEIDLIWDWGGHHPYLLNVVAHTLFNYKASKGLDRVSRGDEEELRRRIHSIVYRFFSQIWQELGDIGGDGHVGDFSRAQSAVIRIACNMDIEPVIDEELLLDLKERGVVLANGGKPTLFAGFFEDFVIREIIRVKPLDLDPEGLGEQREVRAGTRLIRVNGREVEVTAREYRILCLLNKRPGKPITFREIAEVARHEIAEAARHEGEETSLSPEKQVAVWMSRLRRRLEAAPVAPFRLEIVSFREGYGIRYRQAEPQSPGAEC